ARDPNRRSPSSRRRPRGRRAPRGSPARVAASLVLAAPDELMSSRTFRVRDRATLAEVLAKMDEASAAREGRAFVNGVRSSSDARVDAGDVIEVHAARVVVETPTVLARSGGIVFADKPAGLATTPERRGARSLESEVARLLGVASLHAASRLDVGVSG